MPRVALTRTVSFSSGHRYWRADLTRDENLALFGNWASPFNHGHNYVLHVTVEGEVDPSHGMVVNIKDIDAILKSKVLAAFDQKSINDEVDHFALRAPSIENLLLYFGAMLGASDVFPAEVRLIGLKLEETPLLYGEIALALTPMVELTRVYEFAASHRLHVPALPQDRNLELFGKCNNPNGHGHNYVLEVTVEGAPDPESGMMVDIGKLDQVVSERVLLRYDHKNLDLDVEELRGLNTTSEVVSLKIFEQLEGNTPAKLSRIRLFETARNMFEVRSNS